MDASKEHDPIRIDVAVFVLGIALVLIGGWLWFGGGLDEVRTMRASEPGTQSFKKRLSALSLYMSAGSYEEATRLYEEELSAAADSESVGVISQSSAFFTVAPAYFKQSGSIEDARKEIVAYQTIAADTRAHTLRFGRAHALYALAAAYDYFGRDERLLDDIFSGEYAAYRVNDNPHESARHLMEQSYELFPLSFTAAWLSSSHINTALTNELLSEKERSEHKKTALVYLRSAEALAQQGIEDDFSYVGSHSFTLYRYWSAVAVGMMALSGDEEMRNRYEGEFEEAIDFLDKRSEHAATEKRSFIRLIYAALVHELEENGEYARELLREAVIIAQEDPWRSSNGFMHFVGNEKLRVSGDFFWRALMDMTVLSPELRAFVDAL